MIGSREDLDGGRSVRQREAELSYLERDHAEAEREIEESRRSSHMFSRVQFECALRPRRSSDGMAGHAAKTLALVGIIQHVKNREEKRREKLVKERDDLEVQMTEERSEIERIQREEEERGREGQDDDRGQDRAEQMFGGEGQDRDDDRDRDEEKPRKGSSRADRMFGGEDRDRDDDRDFI